MHKTTEEWISHFKTRAAWWTHSGNFQQPHVILHSTFHSNGFFMSKLVTEDAVVRREIAEDMLEIALKGDKLWPEMITCVVGAPTSATKLAEDVFATKVFSKARYVSMQKDENDGMKRIFFDNDPVRPNECCLVVEDVTTSGGSIEMVTQAIHQAGGSVYPLVLTILNRSGKKKINGRIISPLVDYPMETWSPEPGLCKLCSEGSQALRPKVPPGNWELLTKDYS